LNYDLCDSSISLIAKNILIGAKYFYYIPKSKELDYKSFRIRLEEKLKELNREMPEKSKNAVSIFDNNVHFFYITDEENLCYNFSISIFSDPHKNTGCWYVNKNDITINNSSQNGILLMVRMGTEGRSLEDVIKLKKIFQKLIIRYNFKDVKKTSRIFE
jgi:hypothetical protein